MAEYIEPLPYPFTMVGSDGRVNPNMDQNDLEEEWGDILRALEDLDVWPHTHPNRPARVRPIANTADRNRSQIHSLRSRGL